TRPMIAGMRTLTGLVWVVLAAIVGATPADAQVRMLDRLASPSPSMSSKGQRAGDVHIDLGVPRAGRTTNGPTVDPGQGLVLPHWTSAFAKQATTFPFAVVGTDPALGQTTVIPTVVIPYRVVFPNQAVFDASADLVDGVTPVSGVLNSPIFKSTPWSAGSTAIGTTQFGDAMMRANFWSRLSDKGAGYHVLLSTPLVTPTITIV